MNAVAQGLRRGRRRDHAFRAGAQWYTSMTDSEPVQCPICGWTGHATDLDEEACPTCGEPVNVTFT